MNYQIWAKDQNPLTKNEQTAGNVVETPKILKFLKDANLADLFATC